MQTLWSQIKDNLSFLAVSLVVIAALALAARAAEHFSGQKCTVSKTRRITIIAMCAAIAAILLIFDFSIPFLAPEFYKIDFSELPVLLCGFYVGPSAAVACEAVKILLKLLLKGTTTAFVGDFANFVVGCSLVLPATIVYYRSRSRRRAVLGLILGIVCITVFGSAFNAVYLLPRFSELYGIPLDAIVGMGTAINSRIQSVTGLVLLSVAPLNLIKGTMVSVLTMLLYKKVARPLFAI